MNDSTESNDQSAEQAPEPTPAPADDPVEIENGPDPVQASEQPIDEDDASLLDPAARCLEPESTGVAEGSVHAEGTPAASTVDRAQDGDSDWTADDLPTDEPGQDDRQRPDWMEQVNPHDVMVELKRIEKDIRNALEDRDPKRKRKFAGTRRWVELEDDIISWRFSGRFDEEMLTLLQRLISRRHYLVRHLRFLSGTRPVWNS